MAARQLDLGRPFGWYPPCGRIAVVQIVMTLANIMVSLDGSSGTHKRARLACNLAKRFDAVLTGLAMQDPLPMSIYGRGSYLDRNIINRAAENARKELQKQEEIYDEATSGYSKSRLLKLEKDPVECIISKCAGCDLLIARGFDDGKSPEIAEAPNPAEIIMRAGRPVLLTPSHIDDLPLECAIIAWKDTREARRAVADALPLLQIAGRVLLLSVTTPGSRSSIDAIEQYLCDHHVRSERNEVAGTTHIAEAIARILQAETADLLVSGAYGHSKMREFVYGSLTHELMTSIDRPCLYSH